MLRIAAALPSVTHAAVPKVSAAAAPAVTSAASHRKRLATYSPDATSNSFSWMGCWAASAIAACTSGGIVDAESTV